MARIEFIAKAQQDAAGANQGATGAEITHGLTIASGDLLVAFVNRNGTTTAITQPDGWVEIKQADGAETSRYWIGYREAKSAEPAVYQWDIGVNDSWDIQIRQFRTKGTNLFVSPVVESSTSAQTTVGVTTGQVPKGAISFVHANTDSSGVTASAVDSEYVEHYATALSSRQQYSAHRVVDTYALDAGTVNFTSSGSTTSENNHFYISFTFADSVSPFVITTRKTTPSLGSYESFDTSGQRCEVEIPGFGNAYANTEGLTICGWAQYKGTGADSYQNILGVSTTQTGAPSWAIERSRTLQKLGWWDTADRILTADNQFLNNQWWFFAFSRFAAAGTYLGVSHGFYSENTSFNPAGTSDWVTLFGKSNNGNEMSGYLSNIKIWTHTIPFGELLHEQFSYEPIHQDGLLAWYPLDKDFGLKDASGNGFHMAAPSGGSEPVWSANTPPLIGKKVPILCKPDDRRVVVF